MARILHNYFVIWLIKYYFLDKPSHWPQGYHLIVSWFHPDLFVYSFGKEFRKNPQRGVGLYQLLCKTQTPCNISRHRHITTIRKNSKTFQEFQKFLLTFRGIFFFFNSNFTLCFLQTEVNACRTDHARMMYRRATSCENSSNCLILLCRPPGSTALSYMSFIMRSNAYSGTRLELRTLWILRQVCMAIMLIIPISKRIKTKGRKVSVVNLTRM